ncbi:MAG TPA: diguanylate cyclase [Candidatus Limnocylindria bacterium]|nr:diguanylate cyclase [Candidatus Limnocylindria bacterium]
MAADPYLFYTATLVPVVLAVAVAAQRPREVPMAIGISAAALGAQWLLARWVPDAIRRRARLRSMLRLGVPLLYVAVAVQLIGGPALPLLALFAPVVAGAAAIGPFQGWATAGIAAAVYLLPEVGNLGSPAAVVLRGITLAGVALVLAFGTRRIVLSLEAAVRQARRSAAIERRRGRQIEALETVGRVLAGGGPSPELIDRVADIVATRFGYPHVSVYLGDERRVELTAQRGYVETIAAFDPATGVAGRVLRTRQLAFVPDVTADADYVPGTLMATSLICAPLLVDGQFLGILNVETSAGRRLDLTDRNLVSIVAARIATAIALGRDRQALADRANLFRDIDRFGRDVSASLAVGPLAEVIAEAVCRVVEADLVAVTLIDRSDGRYLVRAARGAPESVVGRELRVGEGLAGRAIRDRAMVVDTMSEDRLPTSVRSMAVPPMSIGVAQPLIRDGVVVGALTVARASSDATFSDLEIEGLGLVAAHAALAVANAFLHAEVEELAVRDALTGLYNRRHFDEALDRLLALNRRELLGAPRPLSVIMFDLDRFGMFNKEHGHQVGDSVLRTFADVLRQRFRASDLVARLGGEEFIAVLDGADREAAVAAADEVRALLALRPIAVEDGDRVRVTVSAGCAELDPADPSRESLLRTADVALFMAKRAGRDRVVAA